MADRKAELEIQNKIASVTMNRAEKKNAFDESMFTALEQVTNACMALQRSWKRESLNFPIESLMLGLTR